MVKKYWRPVVVVLILLAGPALSMWSSEKLRYCINNQGIYPTTQHDEKGSAGVFIPRTGTLHILQSCTGGFANDNGGAITGLATVLLTIVTGGLVWIARLQFVTTRAQLRAYIFNDSSFIFDGPTPPNAAVPAAQGCPHSHILIKNSGQTPAYDVRHISRIDIVPVTDDGSADIYPDISVCPPSAIGPGGQTTNDNNLGRALTPYEVNALAAVAQMIVVRGHIVYKDVFGIRRETTYRLAYAGQWPPAPGVNLVFTAKGNRAD